MPRPTILQVAAAAGVSIGTVSRVMNASGPVGAGTAARVRAAADRLGYAPSQAGRTLRSGRSRAFGVLVPTISNPIFARSTEGIEEIAFGRGHSTVLMSSGYAPDAEAEVVTALAACGVDGLILTLAEASPERIAAATAHRVPVVLLYNEPPAAAHSSASVGVATVDSRGAVRALTHEIIARGHRRIAFLGGAFAASDRSRARHDGYRDAMGAAGLPAWAPEELDFEAGMGAYDAALASLLSRAVAPTALVCSNDLLALHAIAAARRLGLRVPGDLSVTGFDGVPMAQLVDPPLATVRQPARRMGRVAAEMLFDMMAGTPARTVVMAHEILPGGTLARPRQTTDPVDAGSTRRTLPNRRTTRP